jgi:hypothetical protein
MEWWSIGFPTTPSLQYSSTPLFRLRGDLLAEPLAGLMDAIGH